MAGEPQNEIELHVVGGEKAVGLSVPAVATVERDRSARDYASRYKRRSYQFWKRVLDIVLSLAALLVLFPVFLTIFLVLAISDGLPVVFKQKRIGQNGQLFDIHKFRTMVRNAEEILRSRPDLMEEYRTTYKIENDPRISKFGHFLRRSSLDELPQLVNVLVGNMSLVGPRPIVEPEIERYSDQGNTYMAMKPGCAGLWQCMGRSATTYAERVELDREYYENASNWFDTVILFHTVRAILTGRGAR